MPRRFSVPPMPELPEVEVTRRGVAPHLEGRTVTGVMLRRSGLRWPFPADLDAQLARPSILGTGRRGKYLLIRFEHGTLIVHLGMSGHLRMLPLQAPPQKHDHFDLVVGQQGDAHDRPAPLRRRALARGRGGRGRVARAAARPGRRAAGRGVFRQRCCTGRRAAAARRSSRCCWPATSWSASATSMRRESLFRARHQSEDAGRSASAWRAMTGWRRRSAKSWRRRSSRAAARCAISLVPMDNPAIFSKAISSTIGPDCRAGYVARPLRQIKQGQRSTFYCAHCQT